MNKKSLWAKAALFAATIIWGFAFIVVKDTVDIFTPFILLALRFSIAFAVLGAVSFNKIRSVINMEYIKNGFVIGLMMFLAYGAQTIGITDTTPGKNAFLTAVYCVMVPFIYWAVKRKNPGCYSFISAIICITGIGFVALKENITIGMGDTMTLAGGFFFALHIVAVTLLAGDKNPIVISVLQFGFAALFSWIVGLIAEGLPKEITAEAVRGILFLGIFPSMIGMSLQIIGQKYTSSASAALILSLEAVFGTVFSILFGYEAMTGKLFFGFVLIFAAIIISETKLSFLKRKKQL